MGYARIEAEAGGRARGERDARANGPHAEGGQRGLNRHMPEHYKSGQSDCPAIEERETPRYHAEQETD